MKGDGERIIHMMARKCKLKLSRSIILALRIDLSKMLHKCIYKYILVS